MSDNFSASNQITLNEILSPLTNAQKIIFHDALENVLDKIRHNLEVANLHLQSEINTSDRGAQKWVSPSSYENLTEELNQLNCLFFTEEDDEKYSMRKIIEFIFETDERITALRVIARDIELTNKEPETNYLYLTASLPALAVMQDYLEYEYQEIKDYFDKKSKLWDSIEYEPEEEEFMEPEGNLSDNQNFWLICASLKNIFSHYLELHKDQNIANYSAVLYEALEHFEKKEEHEEFSFDISYRHGEELSYFEFRMEDSMIEMTTGGSVYFPEIGHDSYASWTYAIWNTGNEDGEMIDIKSICTEMIDLNGILDISLPEEYTE